jgi:hypothetical protein
MVVGGDRRPETNDGVVPAFYDLYAGGQATNAWSKLYKYQGDL